MCFSYFGKNDLSSLYLFYDNPSSLVIHASEDYTYQIGGKTPQKDGIKCSEFSFSNKKRRGCSCQRCIRRNNISYFFVLILIISKFISNDEQ